MHPTLILYSIIYDIINKVFTHKQIINVNKRKGEIINICFSLLKEEC